LDAGCFEDISVTYPFLVSTMIISERVYSCANELTAIR